MWDILGGSISTPHNTTQHYTTPHNTTQHHTTLHNTTQHHTKCRAAKVLWCQNDCCLKVILPKCRSAEMWRVPKCRSVEMSWCQRKKKCRNVVLPKCRAAKMLCYQSVFCQNVVLPICPLPGCRAAQVVVMPKCVLPNCRVFQIVRCREVGEPFNGLCLFCNQ